MTAPVQTCYRHPDRRAGVVCQRCDRPICPDCMNTASVGFHCPECTKSGKQKVVRGPAAFGVSRPVVTTALIALNVAIYVIGIGSGLRTRPEVLSDFGLVSIETPFGAFGVADGEWWRIVTSGFLHFNVIHVAFNMLALYQLGMLLESAFGRLRFALVYGVSLLVASLAVLVLSPDNLTAGASGAVFGLMGFAFMALRARGIDPFSTGIGTTIVLNLIITFTLSEYISVGGHVGGLVGGALAGWILTDLGPRFIRDERMTNVAVGALGGVAFVAALLVGGAV